MWLRYSATIYFICCNFIGLLGGLTYFYAISLLYASSLRYRRLLGHQLRRFWTVLSIFIRCWGKASRYPIYCRYEKCPHNRSSKTLTHWMTYSRILLSIWLDFHYTKCLSRLRNHFSIILDKLFFHQSSKEFLYHASCYWPNPHNIFHLHCSKKFRIHFLNYHVFRLHSNPSKKIL